MQDSRCPDRDLNPVSMEYESGALETQVRRSGLGVVYRL
jgi:hypothetical protein